MKPYDWLINGNDDEPERHNDVVDGDDDDDDNNDDEDLVPLRIDHRLTLPV